MAKTVIKLKHISGVERTVKVDKKGLEIYKKNRWTEVSNGSKKEESKKVETKVETNDNSKKLEV